MTGGKQLLEQQRERGDWMCQCAYATPTPDEYCPACGKRRPLDSDPTAIPGAA